jgi:hypothetical protein
MARGYDSMYDYEGGKNWRLGRDEELVRGVLTPVL